MMMPLNPDHLEAVQQFLHSRSAADGNAILKLSKKAQPSAGVLRLADSERGSIILKIWNRKTLKDRIKRLVFLDNASREWSIHRFAKQQNLQVPEPISFHEIRAGVGHSTAVMLTEDLKGAENALSHFKHLLQTRDEYGIAKFETDLIVLTTSVISAGITDIDHQLNNILVDPCRGLFRIDFECARRHRLTRHREHDLGVMLGRLIGTHVWACQPELQRTESFAERLVHELRPSVISLTVAKATIIQILKKQRSVTGIDSALAVPW